MDKQDVLQRARRAKEDEGFKNAEYHGLKLGYIIFSGLFIILVILNLIMGKRIYDISSLFWGFVAAEAYSRHQFSHTRGDKITMIAASIASAGFLVNHIMVTVWP